MRRQFIFATAVVLNLLIVGGVDAAITNASWVFPASTSPGPSQPIGADLIGLYSSNNILGWIEADSKLNESFVLNPGNTTALEFSYNGNHAAYLNGSALTLSSTVAGLSAGSSLMNVQLSYQTKWNESGNNMVQTLTYSLNGGAFTDFGTGTVAGSSTWQNENFLITGLQLQNGDNLTIRDTFSGAAGNNGNLDFDNIFITSSVAVPEPPVSVLAAFGAGLAGLWFIRRPSGQVKDHRRKSARS